MKWNKNQENTQFLCGKLHKIIARNYAFFVDKDFGQRKLKFNKGKI